MEKTATPVPPGGLFEQLRRVRGFGLFGLLVVSAPVLCVAAGVGAIRLTSSPELGLGFSSLTGRVSTVDGRWNGARPGDTVLEVGGVRVDGDPARMRAAILDLEPGDLELRFRRGEGEWTARAPVRPWQGRLVMATAARVATGGALLAIGIVAFGMRPGVRATWLFLLFCYSLGVHLLVYMALLASPRAGLLGEQLTRCLMIAFGIHLFTVFPSPLGGRRAWLLLGYVPALGLGLGSAFAMLVPGGDPVAAWTMLAAGLLAAAAAAAAVILTLLQYRRASRTADRPAQTRSRAILAAVLLGLVPPAVEHALRTVFGFQTHEAAWIVSTVPIVLFAGLTGYAIARHNALEVDRFTAAVLGYAATTAALVAAFGTIVVGISSLAGEFGWIDTPLAGAGLATAFIGAFNPAYRSIRRRVDRLFRRDAVAEDTALGLLGELARTVQGADLPSSYRAGLATAATLQAERVELWRRRRDGSFARAAAAAPPDAEASPDVDEGQPLPADSPLLEALASGAGGGVRGLTDRALEHAAQDVLWARELVLAVPLIVHDRLEGFLSLGRKRSGIAFTPRERLFLETVASHLTIAIERDAEQMPRLGDYRLRQRIGTGGMAEVFLAEKHGPGGFERQLAIKRMLPHLAGEPSCVAMFFDEARIAAQLRHPNVVAILDIHEEEGTYFLAMEYLDGPTLRDLIQIGSEQGALPSVAVAAAFADAVLKALEYAHGCKDRRGHPLGIVHRDVKPGNVLTSRQGEIKLADFGIARAEVRLHQSVPGGVAGTLPYMSSEQELGRADPRSDLYSVGAVFFEILVGQRAFPDGPGRSVPASVSELRPGLPPSLDAFVRRAFAEAPGDRFGTAGEMRRALREAIRPAVVAPAEEVADYLSLTLGGEEVHPSGDGAPTAAGSGAALTERARPRAIRES